MTIDRAHDGIAAYSNRPTIQQRRTLRQWWTVITTLLTTAVFCEAIFAGVMLSGIGWGRAAHAANAGVLIAATLLAGLVSIVSLRRVSRGRNLAGSLLAMAAVLCLQTALGNWSAHGAHLMWVHVPLGVALVGFAMQAAASARKLGEE